MTVKVGDFHSAEGEDGHFAVVEEGDVAGVVEDAGNVGGYEVLAVAHADHDRRTGARGDDLVWFERR